MPFVSSSTPFPFGGPRRRDEAPLPVVAQALARLAEVRPIPELARHLLVHLIEPLTVVRVLATPHVGTESGANLAEPVGVRKRLPRERNDVCVAAGENALGLIEECDT